MCAFTKLNEQSCCACMMRHPCGAEPKRTRQSNSFRLCCEVTPKNKHCSNNYKEKISSWPRAENVTLRMRGKETLQKCRYLPIFLHSEVFSLAF